MRDASKVSYHRGEKSDVDDSCLTGVAAVSVEMEVMVAEAAAKAATRQRRHQWQRKRSRVSGVFFSRGGRNARDGDRQRGITRKRDEETGLDREE